jgi:hypothetical protein
MKEVSEFNEDGYRIFDFKLDNQKLVPWLMSIELNPLSSTEMLIIVQKHKKEPELE